MSVTNRCKKLTLTGDQCFAMFRSLSSRETWLQAQLETGVHAEEGLEHLSYLRQQLHDVRAVRLAFNTTPFVEG